MTDSAEVCGCGSALPANCCCAREGGSQTAEEVPAGWLRELNNLPASARADTEALCRRVLVRHPTQPLALWRLYHIRKAEGVAPAGEMLLRRLVAAEPNHLQGTQELALLLFNKGDLSDAERHARNCVRLGPREAQSHNLMGMILTEANRPQIGEYHYRQVLDVLPNRSPIVLANLAWNLKNQGRMEESRRYYEESMALDSSVLQTLVGWARMEEADRNFQRAAELLDQAEAVAPGNSTVALSRAVLASRQKRHEAGITIIEAMRQQSRDGELGPTAWTEKGRMLDQLGRYQEAFAAFDAGKARLRQISGLAYRAEQAQSLAGRLKGFFVRKRLDILPRAQEPAADSPRPLFIVGFPRSGTTLVEQTLSAHSQVAAGDELPTVGDITGMLPRMLGSPLSYPEALADLWLGDQRDGLDNLRDFYLQRARQLGAAQGDQRWFTDKMPLNETHLGLIALMFPRTPVIHLLRHPLDVVLSVFSNHLTHGFYCAYALESIARHYVLIMDLVEHYKQEMDLNYLAVHYEDIVDNQEAKVREMLAFIGEPFEAQCLEFHKNRRYARTASYAQVTEKLYSRSRYRYRHYLPQLEPVIPILEPVIKRLKYEV